MGTVLLARILRAYGLDYEGIGSPQTGYRNQSFRVVLKDGRVVNLILYKSEPGILRRIKNANAVSDYLASKGFPARNTASTRIIRLQAGSYLKYGALYNYLPGHTIPWEAYTQDHLKLLGKTMSDMHAVLSGLVVPGLPEVTDEYTPIVARMRAYFSDMSVQGALAAKLLLQVRQEVFDNMERLLAGSKTLPGKQPLHMDFVRSNVLFRDGHPDGKAEVAVSGIIDFEKTALGHPLFDVARTLAFLLVDCKYKTPQKVRKYFLGSGYIKRGAAVLPGKHMGLLEPLLGMFLLHDFYKFLRHNPYESLPYNEHFMRTVQLLIPRHLVVPTTSIARI